MVTMDETLVSRAKELITRLDLDGKRRAIRDIETETAHPDFWRNHREATRSMKKLAVLKKELENGERLEKLTQGNDERALSEVLESLEFAAYLSDPYDGNDAILSIHAGQGGTEAMDWANMLYRMYRRYAEKKGWDVVEIDQTPGEEAGIKSVTVNVLGPYAYGFLKAEAGVHRLVRQSPFNADKLRQTSFAMTEVLPVIEADSELGIIRDEDLEWEFFRSSGKGGQNVNKVSTAVRLRHKPSGIVITSQSERYQAQNREYALQILRSKLWAIEQEKQRQMKQELKGTYKTPGWGNQIRSYVLHPYHMVKDLRTSYETSQTDRVLDGDIGDFIMAYLKKGH